MQRNRIRAALCVSRNDGNRAILAGCARGTQDYAVEQTPFDVGKRHAHGFAGIDRLLYQLAGFPQHLAGKVIHLHLLIHASTSFADSLWSILDGVPSRVSYSLSFVSNIIIDECFEPSAFSQKVMHLLPRWFQAFFPRLKQVSFGKSCHPWENVDQHTFEQELEERCPGCTVQLA